MRALIKHRRLVERFYDYLASIPGDGNAARDRRSTFPQLVRHIEPRGIYAVLALKGISKEIIRKFSADLVEVLRQPQANKEATILVIGIIIVILALVALIFWLIASWLFRRNKAVYELYEAKHYRASGGKLGWAGAAVFSALLIASLGGVYHYGTESSICIRCHHRTLEKDTWPEVHANVACTGCHRRPGVSGHFLQSLDYVRWLVAYTVNKSELGSEETVVRNDVCISCHLEVPRKTLSRWGVRVRHADFLAIGARCLECHGDVTHGSKKSIRNRPTMDKCIVCHDGKRAPAECSMCHTDKASPVTRKATVEIMRIDVEPMRNCRGCHEQTPQSECIRCHGLEMPHPKEWVRRPGQGGLNAHALPGFLEKAKCKKCHRFDEGLPAPIHPTDPVNLREIFCNRCHEYSSPHGSLDRWLKRHGPEALKVIDSDNPLCGSCHSANNERLCSKCHSPDLCSHCHSNGIREVEDVELQR